MFTQAPLFSIGRGLYRYKMGVSERYSHQTGSVRETLEGYIREKINNEEQSILSGN